MRMVQGIDVDRAYTANEIAQMYLDGRLRSITLHGYVARADADGTCRLVPWTDATTERPRVYQTKDDIRASLQEGLPPIRRRTPQQRAASMVVRMLAEAKRAGKVPGLTEEQTREIVGEYWKDGVSEVTAEMVQRVAARFLQAAENEAKAK